MAGSSQPANDGVQIQKFDMHKHGVWTGVYGLEPVQRETRSDLSQRRQ